VWKKVSANLTNSTRYLYKIVCSAILQHYFAQLRSTDVAEIHCSAQITPQHVLQKLKQVKNTSESDNLTVNGKNL
jgi:hypothetical protein